MKIEYILYGIVGLLTAYQLFLVVKNGGIPGAAFGAPIEKTTSEFDLGHGVWVGTKLRVHRLATPQGGRGPEVGIEVVRDSLSGWETQRVSLSRAEARQLATALMMAAEQFGSRGE